mgnify:CR=1 FL=1
MQKPDTFDEYIPLNLWEVTQKDIKQTHPHPFMPQKDDQSPDLKMMTLDNLNALKAKAYRGWVYYKKHKEYKIVMIRKIEKFLKILICKVDEY